jgi:hypothetical protein
MHSIFAFYIKVYPCLFYNEKIIMLVTSCCVLREGKRDGEILFQLEKHGIT